MDLAALSKKSSKNHRPTLNCRPDKLQQGWLLPNTAVGDDCETQRSAGWFGGVLILAAIDLRALPVLVWSVPKAEGTGESNSRPLFKFAKLAHSKLAWEQHVFSAWRKCMGESHFTKMKVRVRISAKLLSYGQSEHVYVQPNKSTFLTFLFFSFPLLQQA